MVCAGVLVETSAALTSFTETAAPLAALVDTRVQMCATEPTSEDETAPVVIVPKATVPPFSANVPSQAVAPDCEPTLNVIDGSTVAVTETWSSVTMASAYELPVMPAPPAMVEVFEPAVPGFVPVKLMVSVPAVQPVRVTCTMFAAVTLFATVPVAHVPDVNAKAEKP